MSENRADRIPKMMNSLYNSISNKKEYTVLDKEIQELTKKRKEAENFCVRLFLAGIITGFIGVVFFLIEGLIDSNYIMVIIGIILGAASVISIVKSVKKESLIKIIELEIRKIQKTMNKLVKEKYDKDLKNKFGAEFVSSKAPFQGLNPSMFSNGDVFRIKLSDGTITNAKIEYDENQMFVRVANNVKYLEVDENFVEDFDKHDSQNFDLIESLKNIDE